MVNIGDQLMIKVGQVTKFSDQHSSGIPLALFAQQSLQAFQRVGFFFWFIVPPPQYTRKS
jgi:hypothetical protein